MQISRSKLLVPVVILCALNNLQASAQDIVTTSNGKLSVQYVGRSGQIKLFPEGSDSENGTNNFMKIKWYKIEEVRPDGRKVKAVNNFASQDFQWGRPTEAMLGENKAMKVDLIASLGVQGVNVGFNVSTWLISEDTEVQNGNQTIAVEANSLKFTVSISGWPFADTANSLRFGAQINSAGNRLAEAEREEDGGKIRSQKFGAGQIRMATEAVVDGRNENITIDNTMSGSDLNMMLKVDWLFPYFQNTLVYDPSLSLNTLETDSSASGTGLSPGATAAVIVAAIVLLILGTATGVSLWQRHKSKQLSSGQHYMQHSNPRSFGL